ncbi:MAG: tRNA (cytidine(56)-2'-O)-methyltransferase, partial [Candidatus Diapherotrites archaeon]|nr:tRNA (cytidine(56)-2'-O)-methyltransferase [Candidatus Diapherotrites archaeon]
AAEFILSGDNDQKLLNGVNRVTQQFGGLFHTEYVQKWRPWLKQQKKEGFKVVHLTMYGLQLNKQVVKLRKHPRLVVVVGSAKVPPDLYELADYNISIGNQPHSEVAAISLFLHEYYKGRELNKVFKNAKKTVIPKAKGKNVRNNP